MHPGYFSASLASGWFEPGIVSWIYDNTFCGHFLRDLRAAAEFCRHNVWAVNSVHAWVLIAGLVPERARQPEARSTLRLRAPQSALFLDPVKQVADAQMYGSWISAVSLWNWYQYLCSFSI